MYAYRKRTIGRERRAVAMKELPGDLVAALKDPVARERLQEFFAILYEWDQRRAATKEHTVTASTGEKHRDG
jgi:hypothetical protein